MKLKNLIVALLLVSVVAVLKGCAPGEPLPYRVGDAIGAADAYCVDVRHLDPRKITNREDWDKFLMCYSAFAEGEQWRRQVDRWQ